MNQKYEKLKTLLKELFQLDQPDLDFGLYRIMHAKSAEVTQFLDKDLLPQVKQALGHYKSADKAELEKELAKVIAGVQAAGMDAEQSPKVKELRARIATDSVDLNALESEVYDHLFTFFRRYYSEGDFLAKRVYKPGVYAIPYEGEEVKLHWANRDQYYIKTSEYLRDYSFRIRPGDNQNPMRVHFRLVDAAEDEQGNLLTANGKERMFFLAPAGDSGRDFLAVADGELSIHFEYRSATIADWSEQDLAGKAKPPTQQDLIENAEKRILAIADSQLLLWVAALGKPHIDAKGESANYSRLAAHLRRYTARNTFDYFIHKDLGGFLRQELNFYIQNEIMHLDDLGTDSETRAEQYLSKIKVIRPIAQKIITFLAQLEDFQKKLWLKRKFIVDTQYCATLDRIPKKFYEEIAANEKQRAEWVDLFAIDKFEGDLITPGYTLPLSMAFLDAHLNLVVDTKHFAPEFTAGLLETLEQVDAQMDGLLVHGENFQALNLLLERYSGQVGCIYIDPPYNTGGDEFLYKDNYRESSWLSLLQDRLLLSRSFMKPDGTFACSIDLRELDKMIALLDECFGQENRRANITVKRGSITGAKVINPGPVNISENVLLYSVQSSKWKPQKAYREKEYDSRYGSLITNPDSPPQEWKFASVLDEFAKNLGITKGRLRKTLGDKYDTSLMDFVLANSSRVIRFAALDDNSVSKEALETKELSKHDPEKLFHIPRADANDYFIKDGLLIPFYKDRLIKVGDRLVPGELLSDIWDDVLPNDLHNEGGVELRKGKKPERLIHRIFGGAVTNCDLVLEVVS